MSKKKPSKAEIEAMHAAAEEEERLALEAEVKRIEEERLKREEEVCFNLISYGRFVFYTFPKGSTNHGSSNRF